MAFQASEWPSQRCPFFSVLQFFKFPSDIVFRFDALLFWLWQHHGLQDHQLVLGQQEVQRPHHHRLRFALRRRQRKTSLHHGEYLFHVDVVVLLVAPMLLHRSCYCWELLIFMFNINESKMEHLKVTISGICCFCYCDRIFIFNSCFTVFLCCSQNLSFLKKNIYFLQIREPTNKV